MSDPARLYDQALSAFDRGDWREAYRLAALAGRHAPWNVDVHYVAGIAALELGQAPLAGSHLQLAAGTTPLRIERLAQYARALAMAHRMAEATATADVAMGLPASDADSLHTLGVAYSKANEHAKAADAFRRAVALDPGRAGRRFELGTSLMYFGDRESAEREYEACLGLDPRHWRAWLALVQLRRQTPERNHVGRLEAALAAPALPVDARLHLHLALAKAREDLGEYDRAFAHYAQGKQAMRDVLGSSDAEDAELFDAVMRVFDRTAGTATGHDSCEPVFVMGMPRSGTTLVDRILASHPMVTSAGELGHFGAALHRAGGGRARSLAEMVQGLGSGFDGWAALGRDYVDSTRPLTGRTPRFVDKLPHNFLYAGFIARALPNATLVCLRRSPLDSCLSNFRQLFAGESPYHRYSFDLVDTARHYVRFHRLMAFWQDRLPGRIVELDYEQLVEAQEATTRRLLDACGLPWDAACLAFERSEGAVPTASAMQVREGMNRASLHRWKAYGHHLDPVRAVLAEAGIALD